MDGRGHWRRLDTLASPRRATAIPPIGRTRPSHLKLSIAAYSYRDYLTGKKSPKLDLFEFVNLAADMALDGVEPTSYYFPPDVTFDYLNRLKLHAFSLGLDISGTAVGNNFCLPPGPKRDEQIALVERWIDRAAELDAPVIRIFAGNVSKGLPKSRRWPGPSRESTPFCRTPPKKESCSPSRIMAGLPRHPEQILKLVKAIDSPSFGVNLDTGNFHGSDPYAEIAQLAPYAMNVQVKTEIKRSAPVQGRGRSVADRRHLARSSLLGVCRPRVRGG